MGEASSQLLYNLTTALLCKRFHAFLSDAIHEIKIVGGLYNLFIHCSSIKSWYCKEIILYITFFDFWSSLSSFRNQGKPFHNLTAPIPSTFGNLKPYVIPVQQSTLRANPTRIRKFEIPEQSKPLRKLSFRSNPYVIRWSQWLNPPASLCQSTFRPHSLRNRKLEVSCWSRTFRKPTQWFPSYFTR